MGGGKKKYEFEDDELNSIEIVDGLLKNQVKRLRSPIGSLAIQAGREVDRLLDRRNELWLEELGLREVEEL